jgi:hypothetical protein
MRKGEQRRALRGMLRGRVDHRGDRKMRMRGRMRNEGLWVGGLAKTRVREEGGGEEYDLI